MTKMKTILSSLLLGSWILLASGTLGVTHSSTRAPLFPKITAGSLPLTDGIIERVRATSITPILESADAVLIQAKEWQWQPYLRNALNLPDWLDLGLEHRTRFEVYDHPWRSSQELGRTDPQIQQRSRVRLGLNGDTFKFLFEGQDSRVHLSNVSQFDFLNTGTRNEYDILQLFVSATAKNTFGKGLRTDLHFGRFTMDFGNRRLIARNDFRNTTNTFDGMHWQLTRDKRWRIRAFLVEPVLRDQVQLDEQSKRLIFWGTYVEAHHVPWLRLNAYYFGLNDQRSSIILSQRTFSTFGLRLFQNPHKGQMDYETETVWQTGKRGNTDHFAHFQHFNLGYTFDFPWSPRILFHYDYASGDSNATDKQDSTFDTLFGARRFEYTPTGNFGPFFRSNISSPGWRVILVPAKGWKFQLKHRLWYLATSRGAFAGSGLRDATGGSGNYLGHDVEVRVQWKLNNNLEFDAGYDHWFKGSYFDRLPSSANLPPGGKKDTDYFYILTKFRF